MRIEKLVMMANQIAAFFAIQGEERAVPQIAKHLTQFWDPRMRTQIIAYVNDSGSGLTPLAKAGILQLTQSH